MLHLEDFNDFLKKLNPKRHIFDIFDDMVLYGLYEEYNIRCNYDTVEIGVRKSFDKWGNSIDFILPYKVIRSEKDVNRLHILLITLINSNQYDSGWSKQMDIYPKFRKIKA